MPLTEIEILEIEIEAAWEVFCDANPFHHAERLKEVEPKFYELLKLAYSHGYMDGGASIIRGLQK